MQAKVSSDGSVEYDALAFMLCAVLGYSATPLVVAIAGGESPFLFNAGWRLGLVAGFGLFGALACRGVWNAEDARKRIFNGLRGWATVAAVFSNNDYALFVLAAAMVHISAATIIFETWPLWMILMMAYAYRKTGRYRRNLPVTVTMIVLCVVGLCFVVAGQSGTLFGIGSEQGRGQVLLGSVIALTGAVVSSFAAFSFKWSTDLSEDLLGYQSLAEVGTRFSEVGRQRFLELVCLVAIYGVSSSLNALASLGVGIVRGESTTFTAQSVAFVGGILTYAPATIAWRMGNLNTTNLGANAVIYGTPVLSLVWLFLLSLLTAPLLSEYFSFDIVRIDYLVVGVISIIVANLLVNFEAEVRFGFKALILALWTCGTFVYLRDEFLHLLPFGGWLWPRETYLGALGFSATVFILLLTFRVARIAPRTQDEDNRIFALHRNLELLARRGLIAPEASEHVRAIDGSRNVEELRRAYTRVKLCFVQAAAVDLPLADRRLLTNAETQLNMMVHSRQQGVDFGELFALIIFGGSTVLLSLLSRPEVSGWTAFLYEVFSALFPAVIIFLIVNVWDLHRDRANLVLATQEGPEGYGVIFRDPKSRRFEQGVSVVIGLLIIVAYAVLLWYKWIG